MIARKSNRFLKTILVLVSLYYLVSVIWLVVYLPDFQPLGGPDESLHISLTKYLVNHHSWPAWDTPELKRYVTGASYATGSSFGYWVEAVFLEFTGRNRISGLLFFGVIFGILVWVFRKSPLAGLAGFALLTPQTIFIFSYVNSDAWSCLIAFLLGCAIVRFKKDPTSTARLTELMIASGACISCRNHIWAIGFVALLFAIIPHLKSIIQKNLKGLCIALIAGTIIASWWPITSYLVNDGDFIGLASGKKAVELFGDPEQNSLAQSLDQFNWPVFTIWTSCSFYGRWGWMTVSLPGICYVLALPLFMGLILLLWSRMTRWLPIFLTLILFNIILLLVYSTTYDFQPQGRYLFGSYFIILGIMAHEIAGLFTTQKDNKKKVNDLKLSRYEKKILILSLTLLALNMFSSISLSEKIHNVKDSFYVYMGTIFLKQGEWEEVEKIAQAGLKRHPENAQLYNALGSAIQNLNRTDEAEACFRKSLELKPKQNQAFTYLGNLYLIQNRLDEAIEQGEILTERFPILVEGYAIMLAAYEKKQDTEKMKEVCHQLLKHRKNHFLAVETLKKLEKAEKKK
jgi:Tfp pilus assembly protein PilF